MKFTWRRYDLWLTVLLFLLMIPAEYQEWFATPENQTLSLRHILRNAYGDPQETAFPADKIAIVVQDEEFFNEYGSFPLRRTDLGKIVANLKLLGARIIMVDMLMDFRSSYGEDPILAQDLSAAGNTILVSLLQVVDGRTAGINYPTQKLRAAAATAYSNHTKSGNMITRLRVYGELGNRQGHWPISVQTAADYLGVTPRVAAGKLSIGETVIDLDHFGDLWTDFTPISAGVDKLSMDPLVGLSAMDILDLDTDDEDEIEEYAELIEGKIVFLGDTSEMSHDYFDTPVGEVYGVEILAMETATLLNGGRLRAVPTWVEILQLALVAGVLIALHRVTDSRTRGLLAAGLLVGYIGLAVSLFIWSGWVLSMAYTLVAGVLGFVVINGFLFMHEQKQKNYIKNAFGQYLSPQVIEVLVDDPSKLSLGGERREMTAFFSDVAGFSTISEKLNPDQLVPLLNEYLTEMTDIVGRYNGTVDKFEGDAIIAFWGAPLEQADHAVQCCLAAIEMQKELIEMRDRFRREQKPEIRVRMGINTGPMVVGNMGSQKRMDYTIMGDAVNLAARLEGANKFFRNESMISHATYTQAQAHIDVRELDTIRVVGKKEPITVYDLLDRKKAVNGKKADLIATYNKGLELYKARRFGKAVEVFQNALMLDPRDGPSLTYEARCRRYIEKPPPDDWDGVHNLTAKG